MAGSDIDGCSSTPACGTGASCHDVAAPGTGYTCKCNAGYTGTDVTDGAATCTEIQCAAITTIASTTTAGADSCSGGGVSTDPTCTFNCAASYEIASGATNPIACGIDGTWPTSPACVEKQCEWGMSEWVDEWVGGAG